MNLLKAVSNVTNLNLILMKSSDKLLYGSIFLFVALVIQACHPTEENYKAAYDAAIRKKNAGIEPEILEKIEQEERPSIAIVDGDTVYTKAEHLSLAAEGDSTLTAHEYNVAVGCYKMIINARAHRDRLKSKGYNAYLIMTGEPQYYVIAGGFDNLHDAGIFLKKFKSDNPGQYVGINEPIIEIMVKPRLQNIK